MISKQNHSMTFFRAGREFGLVVGSMLILVGGWCLYRNQWLMVAKGFLGAGLALVVLGLLLPRVTSYLNRVWMTFAKLLSLVTTSIILAIIFLLLVMPTGFLKRLSGWTSLRRREASAQSYWGSYQLDSSSFMKTALSDLSQVKTAAEAKPVAEAFSGGVEIIERLADEWRELCAEGPCDQPFFRPEWIESYIRAFAPQSRLLIVTARVNGRLRALLPLVEGWELFHGLPVRMLRSPTNVHSCRFDLVHGAGQEVPRAVRAVWKFLRERRGWDLIELRLVPDGGASENLLSLASSDGHLTGQWKMSPGPYIALPGEVTTLEAALKHTTSKFRYSVRRRQRKLEEEGELRLISTTAADPTELERFYQLERAGWKGEEGTAIACAAETRKFYDGVAHSATRFGYLSLYRLDCGDRTVAMHYGLNHGGRYYLLKPAYDENFSHGAPGHVITSEVLRELLAQGAKEFDFLMPQMDWKLEWAMAARPHAFCYIFARSFVGRALHAYKFRLRPLRNKLFASEKELNLNPEVKT